jgi:hypothetical protein
MKKYIVLSVNDNPDYLFHVPLTVWAWKKLGWEPIVFYDFIDPNDDLIELIRLYEYFERNDLNVEDYQSETITQVSRLYGACIADGYIMTGDIDMLPLSDYWQPDLNKLTVYGRDLTDYHYPICYIGAPSMIWRQVMDLVDNDYNTMIKQDLDSMPQAKGAKNVRWVTDQDLITERINNSGIQPVRVDRGTDKRTGYPIGRIDRSNWKLDHAQYIDCHMFHGIQNDEAKFKKTLDMLHTVWPQEDFMWWINYYKEFKKLCQK